MKTLPPPQRSQDEASSQAGLYQAGYAVVLIFSAGALYLALLGHRTDYVGHMLAGYGGTLALLAITCFGRKHVLGWDALGITALAILIGVGTEFAEVRILRLAAFFDPVDFVNQSLGACLACASVLRRTGSPTFAGSLFVISLVALVAGFRFSFA